MKDINYNMGLIFWGLFWIILGICLNHIFQLLILVGYGFGILVVGLLQLLLLIDFRNKRLKVKK